MRPARARLVDGTREQLLAGAGLGEQEHRDVGGSEPCRLVLRLDELRSGCDDRREGRRERAGGRHRASPRPGANRLALEETDQT